MLDEQELIRKARETHGAPVCLDFLDEALRAGSMAEAIDILVIDSYYWDYSPCL